MLNKLLRNRRGHFTPVSSICRLVAIILVVMFMNMTKGGSIDPGVADILGSIIIVVILASFIPI